jgi:integrase
MTSTTNSITRQIVPFPSRGDYDPELTKRELAQIWRCSTKTIERYVDAGYMRPRGLRPLPSFTTPLGRRRFRLHDLGDAAVVVLGGAYGQVYRSFILATGYIGCRLNEGLNLEHRDLRPREREVDLRVTKFSKPRTVLLLPEAWDVIRPIPRQAKHDRVWYAKRGGPITKGNHQSLWTPVRALWWGKLSEARRRELVDFDWHSLRHFTAHFFYVVRGYGPELAAYQLGHTDPNLVIRRYGKPFQGALDRLKRASDGPRVVPLRPMDENAREGGRGA